MTAPFPVIMCDVCRTVTPARLPACASHPAISEEQRVADLRAQGWTLTPKRDTCPHCTGL